MVFGPYGTVLRHPGAIRFVSTGVLARFEMAMTSIGIILLAKAQGDSYAQATMITGAGALSGAICGPLLSRRTDRHGQRVMLIAQVSGYLPAALGLVLSITRDAPLWGQAGCSALAGALNPPITAMVRARWSSIYRGTPLLRTAFQIESMLDATVIAVGAPLAVFLATSILPAAALLVAIGAASVGAVVLAAQRRTEPPVTPRASGRRRTGGLVPPGSGAILVTLFFVGGYLASFDVSTIAVALDRHWPQIGGWALGAYATGSAIGGMLIGHVKGSDRPHVLWCVVLGSLTVGVGPMILARGPVLLLVFGFVAGLSVAPSIIVGLTLTESIAPVERITEALAWTGSMLVVGVSLGQLVTGQVISRLGANTGYVVTIGCAGLAFVTAVLAHGRLTTERRDRERRKILTQRTGG